jgi:ArsR family transcriptional regulator, arsenate/arsenite/antimonite-responsive transcriptional repressor
MNIEVFGCMIVWADSVAGIFLAGRGDVRYTLGRPMDRAQVEKISKALADQTRLRIFEAISNNNHMNCGEIVSMRGVTPATVSHHLKILSEAGLIDCRREGQFVFSQAVPETIKAYTQALTRMALGKKSLRRR